MVERVAKVKEQACEARQALEIVGFRPNRRILHRQRLFRWYLTDLMFASQYLQELHLLFNLVLQIPTADAKTAQLDGHNSGYRR